jgi:hypothetical protein
MDFTGTNQADAKGRIPIPIIAGIRLPVILGEDQRVAYTGPKNGFPVMISQPNTTIITNPTSYC